MVFLFVYLKEKVQARGAAEREGEAGSLLTIVTKKKILKANTEGSIVMSKT